MHRIAAGSAREQVLGTGASVRVRAEVLLERELEVLAERQVAEVVEQ